MKDKSPRGEGSGRKESDNSSRIAAAIRDFRRELGLTQVQFAVALGITPTSVYRYESGSSVPTNDILVKILQHAVISQTPKSVQDFTDALSNRTGFNVLAGEQQGDDTPFLRAVRTLRLEKRLLVMAVVSMLLDGKDDTANRVLDALLAPWVDEAKKSFGKDPLTFSAQGQPASSSSARTHKHDI